MSQNGNFVMCVRAVKGGTFIAEPGKSLFLVVPPGDLPSPKQALKQEIWVKKLLQQATWGTDSRTGEARGDILVFVHGYNNSQEIVMARHQQLESDLRAAGFLGAIMSFDWPSADMSLNYVEDRHDAKLSAMQLVSDGIRIFAEKQEPGCTINIHLLCHSTGAYVIREAFDDADDAQLDQNGWMASQIAFIAGDVSADSLTAGNPTSESLYRHCVRLTNYSNLADPVLKLSNTKRLGMAARVGRVGLPLDAPPKAVNVDCTDYFESLRTSEAVRLADQSVVIGHFEHSWHIGNKLFARDLFETLRGDLDRTIIPTRQIDELGRLELRRP